MNILYLVSISRKATVSPPSEEHERLEYVELLDRCVRQVGKIEKKIKIIYMVTQSDLVLRALIEIWGKVCFFFYLALTMFGTHVYFLNIIR
jgi:hypothetical protein